MSYFAPYIDSTGIRIPAYADIVADLVAQAKQIYGQDIYLEPDSQDYQLLSIVAAKANDANLFLQAVYNARGPATSVGSGLDVVVGVNGLVRGAATYSTAPASLAGTAGAVIAGGVAGDDNGNQWSVPSPTTIGPSGTTNVTVTATTPGPIAASAGQINQIVTPMLGWTGITNTAAATLGVAQETDSVLRARQAFSTAQPSKTLLEGTQGAIAAVPGVTRFVLYENDQATADAFGNPGHSITAVVEGGDDLAVATAIWLRKGGGPLANGTTQEILTDSYGLQTTIGFYRPAYQQIDVTLNIKKLTGFTSATSDAIQGAVVNYLNAVGLGATSLPLSSLWGASLATMANLAQPTFSITSLTAALHGQPQGTADIPLAFATTTQGVAANIVVNAS